MDSWKGNFSGCLWYEHFVSVNNFDKAKANIGRTVFAFGRGYPNLPRFGSSRPKRENPSPSKAPATERPWATGQAVALDYKMHTQNTITLFLWANPAVLPTRKANETLLLRWRENNQRFNSLGNFIIVYRNFSHKKIFRNPSYIEQKANLPTFSRVDGSAYGYSRGGGGRGSRSQAMQAKHMGQI